MGFLVGLPSTTVELANTYAENALAYLKANKIAPTPENYEVAFTYVQGSNAAIVHELDSIIAEKGSINVHDLKRVYGDNAQSDPEVEKLSDIRTQISKQITEVRGTILDIDANTAEYNKSLQTATEQMSSIVDQDSIMAVLANLSSATKLMESQNKLLEEKLHESQQHIDTLNKDLETVKIENLKDSLTTLANRKHFDQFLKSSIEEIKTGELNEFSLLLLDIDHFKKFNDTYGHQVGDQVLKLVAACMKNNVKGQDLAARYGGEEFVVVLPNTGLESAKIVGEHIRKAVMAKEMLKKSTNERLGRITISIGVASWHKNDAAHAIIERADTCLYLAKGLGRNTVVSEEQLAQHKQHVA